MQSNQEGVKNELENLTYNQIKILLEELRNKKSRLRSLQMYIEEERSMMESMATVKFDKIAVKTSPGNVTEERYIKYLERIEKIQKNYNQLFDEMCAEEDLISSLIDTLNPVEQELIINRYMRGLSAAETGKIMGYDRDYIRVACCRIRKKMVSKKS